MHLLYYNYFIIILFVLYQIKKQFLIGSYYYWIHNNQS